MQAMNLGPPLESCQRRRKIVGRRRANMAQILSDNQVGSQRLQYLGINGIQTFATVNVLAHQPVDLRWRGIVRHSRMNHYRLCARARRKVTLMADAHDFAVEAQREQNLRSRREQRHNPHAETRSLEFSRGKTSPY